MSDARGAGTSVQYSYSAGVSYIWHILMHFLFLIA